MWNLFRRMFLDEFYYEFRTYEIILKKIEGSVFMIEEHAEFAIRID